MYAPCSPWPSWPTPFPYTTLFRSLAVHFDKREEAEAVVRQLPDGLLRRPEISQVRRAAGGGLRSTPAARRAVAQDRKSTRLNASHLVTSYALLCLKRKTQDTEHPP